MKRNRKMARPDEAGGTPESVLTMREACKLLNVHSNTLRRWSDRGLIDSYRIGLGGHRRFRIEDINALLVEQRNHSKRRAKVRRE